MSSDVRRTTIEDRLAEALRNLSFAAQISGGVAGRDAGLCEAIDAATPVLAEYDRTRPPGEQDAGAALVNTLAEKNWDAPLPDRPPEAARDYDEAVIKAREGSPDEQPAVAKDTRGRSPFVFDEELSAKLQGLRADMPKEEKAVLVRECIAMLRKHQDEHTAQPPAAPATTGVHVAHCCIKHGCKYGNPNCPVASGELAGDGSCESCADEPATTGARAEAVAPFGWVNVSLGLFTQSRDSAYAWEVDSNRVTQVFAAPPEVTHGAAIGGDVVTDDRTKVVMLDAAVDAYGRAPFDPQDVDPNRTALAAAIEAAERARATASTRSDGGDVGRDAG